MNILNGKTINEIYITEDHMAILFKTDAGNVKALCDADCCSHTWIEHIEMPALGLPAKVTVAEEIEMPDLGDMDGCDVVAYYGFKITTDKGELVIDYRNDSNGYYGGDLNFPSEVGGDIGIYGGVYGQNIADEVWKPVKEDL